MVSFSSRIALFCSRLWLPSVASLSLQWASESWRRASLRACSLIWFALCLSFELNVSNCDARSPVASRYLACAASKWRPSSSISPWSCARVELGGEFGRGARGAFGRGVWEGSLGGEFGRQVDSDQWEQMGCDELSVMRALQACSLVKFGREIGNS